MSSLANENKFVLIRKLSLQRRQQWCQSELFLYIQFVICRTLSLMNIFIVSQTMPLCKHLQSEVMALFVTPSVMLNGLWCFSNTKANSVGSSQTVPVKRLKESPSANVHRTDRERRVHPFRSHQSRVFLLYKRVLRTYSVLTARNIWDMCSVSECWGQRQNETKI